MVDSSDDYKIPAAINDDQWLSTLLQNPIKRITRTTLKNVQEYETGYYYLKGTPVMAYSGEIIEPQITVTGGLGMTIGRAKSGNTVALLFPGYAIDRMNLVDAQNEAALIDENPVVKVNKPYQFRAKNKKQKVRKTK